MKPKNIVLVNFLYFRFSLTSRLFLNVVGIIAFLFSAPSIVNCQSTLYSEDFNNVALDNKGQNGNVFDVSGVTNWSVNMTGANTMSGSDHFMQTNGYFESQNTDAVSADPVDWFSSIIDITNYSNIQLSLDLSRNSSNSGSGTEVFYKLDSDPWMSFGSQINTDPDNSPSVTGLNGSSVQVKVSHWGTWSSPVAYRHDNILIRGTSVCLPTTAPSGISFSNLNSQSLTVSWTAGNGDRTLLIVSPAALSSNPASGTSYTANSEYGTGSSVGNGYVVFNGLSTTTSAVVSGLDRNTTYTFNVFTFNSSGNCYLEPGTASNQTTANLPIAHYVDNNSNTNDVYTLGSVNGSNGANGKKLTPWATLTYALTQVIAGDTIYVDAGTYTDNALSSPTGGGVIIGAGIGKTIFDNPSADSYFMRIDDNNTTLSDMTLTTYNAQTCGAAENGQVLGIIGATGVKITNVLIDQASTSSDGCGYPIEVRAGASVVFQGGGSTCNNWFAGGGMRVSGATTSATINNYLFYGNRKDTDDGSALRVDDGTVLVRNSRFENNSARGGKTGGAIYQAGGSLNVYDCLFTDNSNYIEVSQIGGTIHIASGNFAIKRSKVLNHIQLGAGESYGAGIAVSSGTVLVDSVYFSGNDGSLSRGTDLFNDGGTVTVRNCTFLSASNQIGSNSGTMLLSNSGSPSASFTTGLTFVNTTAQSYTANPSVPQFTGVCGSITILPIELIDFTGSCEKTHAKLEWSTASEHNNDFFTIERAGSNAVFYELTQIEGALNTTQKTDYVFADYYAEEGVNYYRLSQTDINGSSRELKTISVNNNCLTGSGLDISSSYNSTNNSINLGYKFDHNQLLEATVYNAMGQMVQTSEIFLKASQRFTEINLMNSFSNGIYFLKLSNSSILFSDKIMISK